MPQFPFFRPSPFLLFTVQGRFRVTLLARRPDSVTADTVLAPRPCCSLPLSWSRRMQWSTTAYPAAGSDCLMMMNKSKVQFIYSFVGMGAK